MFRNSSPPIDPRRRDAPTTATLARLEERSQRRGDGGVIALGDALAVALGRDDRELHLDLAAFELARELESRGRKDAEHVAVVREDACHEALDADLRGTGRELLEQPSADAATLVLVRDGERRLGCRRVAKPHVVGDGHHAARRHLRRACPAARLARPSPARAAARRCGRPPRGSRETSGTGFARRAIRRTRAAHRHPRIRGGRNRSVLPSRRMTSAMSATSGAIGLVSIIQYSESVAA